MRRPLLIGALGTLAACAVIGAFETGAIGRHERVHRVSIAKFKFDPATLEVHEGDTIVWTNHDFVAHTASAADKTFDTGRLDPGQSKRIVAARSGVFPYSCRYHAGMKGTVTMVK